MAWRQLVEDCSVEDLKIIETLLHTDSKIDPCLLEDLPEECQTSRFGGESTDKAVFVPLPLAKTWKGSKAISNLVKYWGVELRKSRWRPLEFSKLLLPSTYLKIKPDDIGKCYVVSVRDPWDFHVIFDSEFMVDYKLENDDWMDILKKNAGFRDPLQLFHTMSQLLQAFHEYSRKNRMSLAVPRDLKMKAGDLVIVSLPRSSNEISDEGCTNQSGYRGVVLEYPTRGENLQRTDNKMRVYLLDTGEVKEVLEASLIPLPRSFTGFPPMAVRLALHGISPVGPGWSRAACEKMCELVADQPGKKIFAELYDRNRPSNRETGGEPQSADVNPTGETLWSSPPYFVELRFISEVAKDSAEVQTGPKASKISATNVSVELIKEHFGIEWSLIPFRRHLRRPETQPEQGKGSDKKKSDNKEPTTKAGLKGKDEIPLPSLSRDEVLHFSRGSPYPLNALDRKTLKREITRVFYNDPELACEYIAGEDNILSLRVEGNSETKKESILPLFRRT